MWTSAAVDQNSLIMLSLDLPTPTHFTEMRNKKTKCDWQLWQRPSLAPVPSINLKPSLCANLALAGSPRWTERSSEPEEAAPRSCGPTRCCSTSRAASRNPHTHASARPCWLQREEEKLQLYCLLANLHESRLLVASLTVCFISALQRAEGDKQTHVVVSDEKSWAEWKTPHRCWVLLSLKS